MEGVETVLEWVVEVVKEASAGSTVLWSEVVGGITKVVEAMVKVRAAVGGSMEKALVEVGLVGVQGLVEGAVAWVWMKWWLFSGCGRFR